MRIHKSDLIITNCIFAGNSAILRDGGAICNYESDPTIRNCTFTGNWAARDGGGINNSEAAYYDSRPILIDCILWGNSDSGGADESAQIDAGEPVVEYCCIQGLSGGLGGIGNIGYDPCFVGPGYWAHVDDPNVTVEPDDPHAVWIEGDYHLSQAAAGQEVNSPCVDAGSDLAGYLGMAESTTRTDEVNDVNIVDMGYHYGKYSAERPWDIDGDGDTDFVDYGILAPQWEQSPSVPSADIAPPGGDGIVNGKDLGLLAGNWLWEK